MTDSYLRSLGFAPTQSERIGSRPAFSEAWCYQHDHMANDGSLLFIEHPLGIDVCRLSSTEAPLNQQDVFAALPLTDRTGLEAAIAAFYTAHGGIGKSVPPFVPFVFRPYRRIQ
ncbi:hypothetical protein [Hymenobacter koreensis]|uniref:Uncharacterized protein n=1 Tax=Hymenobacter koreensis TaxID=1084523 RepID=A0ABP8J2A3_9BACT